MLLLTTGLDLPSTIPPLHGHKLIQLQHPHDVMTPRIDSGIQRQSTPFLQRLCSARSQRRACQRTNSGVGYEGWAATEAGRGRLGQCRRE